MDSFRPYLEANRRTTNTVFHVSLNPSPRRQTDRRTVTGNRHRSTWNVWDMADQPYIVFKHNDISREHLHLVSLRVDENGHKLSHDFETE
ncbi:MAG: relaxase/mobilization nuclease domain-containing protein [Alistipes onderdonkii]